MRSSLRDILETLVLTLIIFFLVRSVVQNFRVEGRSMEPTLHNGQYLLVNKAVYWRIDGETAKSILPVLKVLDRVVYLFRPPQRGEIVVFHYPKEPTRDFIKRVIAVPGDTVEVKSGSVYVNGSALEEGYLADEPQYNSPPQRVPEGQYFVLGDNRNYSSDSHVWGMVPEQNVIGKAWLTYWPLSSWGLLPDVALATPEPAQGNR